MKINLINSSSTILNNFFTNPGLSLAGQDKEWKAKNQSEEAYTKSSI